MNTRTTIFITVIIAILIIIGLVVLGYTRTSAPVSPTHDQTSDQPLTTVAFSCDAGKNITAAFYEGQPATSTVASNQPPVPTGSVALALSDGRHLTLNQTISADGGRYANGDESIIFWTKGNGVTFTENNQLTYTGCIRVADNATSLPEIYSKGSEGFSIRYPQGYTVDDTYTYQELGPSHTIAGVKFTIPASLAQGTNLSSDSYVSVEQIPRSSGACTASSFLDTSVGAAKTETIHDTDYSVASSTGAGAGNRYEETVYALSGTNPCIAIRYFIHYGVIENYPAGTVKEFDKQNLLSQFDMIRDSVVLDQAPQ